MHSLLFLNFVFRTVRVHEYSTVKEGAIVQDCSFEALNLNQFFFFNSQIFVLIKGPGWSPGTPRLGDPADLPEVG